MRRLRRRWYGYGGDAVPGRCRAALRGVQWNRYKASVLEIKYRGKSIYEVLNLTVKEALRFFTGQTRILEKLAVLDEVGLGYVRLGQSATTLSGGEAQRVKLAAHLSLGVVPPGEPATVRRRKPAAGSSIFWTNRPPDCTSTM